MRRAARVDANQPEIVAALRAIGATVQHLHAVGQGCPDLLVGLRGENWLIEVKDGDKPPSKQRLTEDEADWITNWNGAPVIIGRSVEEVIDYLTGYDSPADVPPF